MLPINTEILKPEQDSVRLASAQLEKLDYRKLYSAYSAKGRKLAVEPRSMFEVLVYSNIPTLTFSTQSNSKAQIRHRANLTLADY